MYRFGGGSSKHLLGWEEVSNAVWFCVQAGLWWRLQGSCYSRDDTRSPGIRGNKKNFTF
ncbi:hypothetical protein DY000_02020712 [Brassica cretica]|uniref:Uncharacterized protein n=1 Tax=Brassica cretica TaxID=69181 RepID=A0ABQ7E6T8_BRACR|nr:hypothetical protein DY000_02020712 [Brassica cretica]